MLWKIFPCAAKCSVLMINLNIPYEHKICWTWGCLKHGRLSSLYDEWNIGIPFMGLIGHLLLSHICGVVGSHLLDGLP